MLTMIKTSDADWFKAILECYRDGRQFQFVDDQGIGITKDDLTSGLRAVKSAHSKAGIPWNKITGALAGIGVSSAGIWLILVAAADQEPTSKFGILLAGGVVLLVTGSMTVLWSLGRTWNVTCKAHGFEVRLSPGRVEINERVKNEEGTEGDDEH